MHICTYKYVYIYIYVCEFICISIYEYNLVNFSWPNKQQNCVHKGGFIPRTCTSKQSRKKPTTEHTSFTTNASIDDITHM